MTPDVPRRAADEILALHRLEPSVGDIYVEGETDRALIEWFLGLEGSRKIAVYPIDAVDVPGDAFRLVGLESTLNRNRVIALARWLNVKAGERSPRICCVVDADFDRILGRCLTEPLLSYTDYTSMEMYFFNPQVLGKFLTLGAHCKRHSPVTLLKEMSRALTRIFLLRATNERLNWKMKFPRLKKYVSLKSGHIRFREREYVAATLMANRHFSRSYEFAEATKECQSTAPPDPRHNIRGHDFTWLLLRWLSKLGRRGCRYGSQDTLEAALRGAMERDFVTREPLFVRLRSL